MRRRWLVIALGVALGGALGCEGASDCEEGDCDVGSWCNPDSGRCEDDCLQTGCEGEAVCNPESHGCQESCATTGCGDGTHCDGDSGLCEADCTEGSCGDGELCNTETRACEPALAFDDPALDACVREDLGLAEGPVLPSAVAGVTHLECPDRGIASLGGLEQLVGLVQLTLWENAIVDVSPLEGLTSLEELQLGNNQIADLSPLAGLTALRALGLSDNQIEDLSPLAGLSALRWLNLDHNLIADIDPLEGLSELTWLTLEHNRIGDRTLLLDLERAGVDVYSRDVEAELRPDREPLPDRDLGIGRDRGAMRSRADVIRSFRTDGEGVVTFELIVDGEQYDARHEFEGEILFDGERFVYRLGALERAIGEVVDDDLYLCSGAYEDVCDLAFGERLPEPGDRVAPGLDAARLEPVLTVNFALRPMRPFFDPPGDPDYAYGDYHDLLDPFVLASPNQQDAGSCLNMAVTGTMEILLNQHTPLEQIEYEGDTDLSERYLMNASEHVPGPEMPYHLTDLVYTFNVFGGALLNRDYRFTAGYVRESGSGYVPAEPSDPDAYFSCSYNWIDELPSGWQDQLTETPAAERTIIFVDPAQEYDSRWAVALMNMDVVERIKHEVRTRRAPVVVVYNHYLYWHADLVVGYDDTLTHNECPMVNDMLDYFRSQGASGYVARIQAHMDEEGGCSDRGIFFVRDSIYDGREDEIYYDYSDRYDFRERYSRRVITRTYDWVRYLSNHAYTVHRL